VSALVIDQVEGLFLTGFILVFDRAAFRLFYLIFPCINGIKVNIKNSGK
jgi:hypothetical protein